MYSVGTSVITFLIRKRKDDFLEENIFSVMCLCSYNRVESLKGSLKGYLQSFVSSFR